MSAAGDFYVMFRPFGGEGDLLVFMHCGDTIATNH